MQTIHQEGLDRIKRSVQLLRETIERRTPPDEVMENALADVELECGLFQQTLDYEAKTRRK